MEQEERMAHARSGRDTAKAIAAERRTISQSNTGAGIGAIESIQDDVAAIAPPPGAEDVQYASLAGN